jgi:hypothetical protein
VHSSDSIVIQQLYHFLRLLLLLLRLLLLERLTSTNTTRPNASPWVQECLQLLWLHECWCWHWLQVQLLSLLLHRQLLSLLLHRQQLLWLLLWLRHKTHRSLGPGSHHCPLRCWHHLLLLLLLLLLPQKRQVCRHNDWATGALTCPSHTSCRRHCCPCSSCCSCCCWWRRGPCRCCCCCCCCFCALPLHHLCMHCDQQSFHVVRLLLQLLHCCPELLPSSSNCFIVVGCHMLGLLPDVCQLLLQCTVGRLYCCSPVDTNLLAWLHSICPAGPAIRQRLLLLW